MTKDQERKALEQIKRIMAEVGPESYIGRAFDGCVEMAEMNIDNDFWFSMKERRDAAVYSEDQLRAKMIPVRQELEATKRELSLTKFTMMQESERANKLAAELKEMKTRIRELIR